MISYARFTPVLACLPDNRIISNFLYYDFIREDDLNKRNKVHCLYMMGLGHFVLQEFKKARAQFSRALELDVNHQGARVHLEMCPADLS